MIYKLTYQINKKYKLSKYYNIIMIKMLSYKIVFT